METGSNKSLFTLIAVVIFGIFLSLSYWMFQEELKGVLGSVIDKTSDSIAEKVPNTFLTKINEVTVTDYALSFFCDAGSKVTLLDVGSNNITYSTLGEYYSGDGFYIQAKNLEIAKNYVLSYDITKWSGDLPKLGGRLTLADNMQVYMDGLLIGGISEYNNGFVYPNDNATHHIEIRFDTNKLTEKIKAENNYLYGVHIQPNRHLSLVAPYTVSLENINLTSN